MSNPSFQDLEQALEYFDNHGLTGEEFIRQMIGESTNECRIHDFSDYLLSNPPLMKCIKCGQMSDVL